MLEPLLNITAHETGADFCWGDTTSPYDPPYSGPATGAGVVIGIVDTGIDYSNLDFKNSSGQTRIKAIWDQTGFGGPPGGFSYGSECTESQINSGTCAERDTAGHGTHIAGIAAGNGRATGNGFPAYRYVGMAPEADLIVVKGTTLEYTTSFFDWKVMHGVEYIFQKAQQMGKDAVVLLAMGN